MHDINGRTRFFEPCGLISVRFRYDFCGRDRFVGAGPDRHRRSPGDRGIVDPQFVNSVARLQIEYH